MTGVGVDVAPLRSGARLGVGLPEMFSRAMIGVSQFNNPRAAKTAIFATLAVKEEGWEGRKRKDASEVEAKRNKGKGKATDDYTAAR